MNLIFVWFETKDLKDCHVFNECSFASMGSSDREGKEKHVLCSLPTWLHSQLKSRL